MWRTGRRTPLLALAAATAGFVGATTVSIPRLLQWLPITPEGANGVRVTVILALIVWLAVVAAELTRHRWRRAVSLALFAPSVLSFPVAAVVWLWLFNPTVGFLNTLGGAVGLPPQRWLTDPDIAICTMKVKNGDRIKSIARSLGITPETILDMNSTRSVDQGDTIFVPVRARDLATLLAAGDAFYTVRKKDTLYSIAKNHGLTVAELRELNDLSARASIHPGERLRVSPARTVTAGGM